MPSSMQSRLTEALRSAHLLTGSARDYDSLVILNVEAPVAALPDSRRFATWMWHNTDASMEAALRYLEKVDLEVERRARARYACLDHFGKDYHSMFLEEVSSWNLRDRHMAEALEVLTSHLDLAADHDWGASDERRWVRPALPGIFEALVMQRSRWLKWQGQKPKID
jgi:hypothetical protein